MNNEALKKPQLNSYLSVHHYLEDLYKFRKSTEENFSYEVWAQELDIKHRSFLRQIVIGRRSITEKMIHLLSERFHFTPEEKEYFEVLVHYSNCRNQKQRNIYGQKLMSLMKNEFEQIEISNYYDLVSSTLHPKILALLTFRDFKKSSPNIAKILQADAKAVENGLKILEKLKLICFDEAAQQWSATEKQIKIPDTYGDMALLDYHEQSLQEAIAAKKSSPDQRRYKALLLPMNAVEFSEFWKGLQLFTKEAMKSYGADDLSDRRLYQMNFNIYAVSDTQEALID